MVLSKVFSKEANVTNNIGVSNAMPHPPSSQAEKRQGLVIPGFTDEMKKHLSSHLHSRMGMRIQRIKGTWHSVRNDSYLADSQSGFNSHIPYGP